MSNSTPSTTSQIPGAPDTVFLLGAGASIAAGVPDTRAFMQDFIASARTKSYARQLKSIVRTISLAVPDSKPDVELLLDILGRLTSSPPDPMMWFSRFRDAKKFDSALLLETLGDLRKFIRLRAVVDAERVAYLLPLRQYIDDAGSVDVLSVNYDTCIEQFCSSQGLACEDGFDSQWNPSRFDTSRAEVRLLKLHGSVSWYTTERGAYIRLPVMPGNSDVRLLTGENATGLMLFPAQKLSYEEPLLDLSARAKRLLSGEQTRFLIAIGYSFRDEHIRRLVWDAAKNNRGLRILLVDPEARTTYSRRLHYYTGTETPSPAAGRVICLPYRFEAIFPVLKHTLLKHLREAIQQEATQVHAYFQGQPTNYRGVLKSLAAAEDTAKLSEMLRREPLPYGPGGWVDRVEVDIRAAIGLLAADDLSEASRYLSDAALTIGYLLQGGLHADAPRDDTPVRFHFGVEYNEDGRGWAGSGDAKSILRVFEELKEHCRARSSQVAQPDALNDLSTFLAEVVDWLSQLAWDATLSDFVAAGSTDLERLAQDYLSVEKYDPELAAKVARELVRQEQLTIRAILQKFPYEMEFITDAPRYGRPQAGSGHKTSRGNPGHTPLAAGQ